jgi:hypothetical protein
MTPSALPHSLAGGRPFRRFGRPKGQKGQEKFFNENLV